MNFVLDFELFSKPEWIKDKGSGIINVTNFNLSLHLEPFNKDGKLQFDFADAVIEIENYGIEFKGTSDFSKALSIVLNNFKSFFKNEVVNILGRKLTKSFEDSMNNLLFTGPSMIPL